MGLKEYNRKRDFKKTAEPPGKKASSKGNSFVIQKHDASRLHYDFRLELNGVLLSWAVPKGPSLDPSQKRLAMHVEDHPVEYGGFEGIIPQGEYGGGTVMLWDRGTWEPIDGDPVEGHYLGRLKFRLHGEKLHGGWMLVRKGGSKTDNDSEKSWFLFKERDEHARPLDAGDILEEESLSVISGRDLDEIAADRDRVWGSNRTNNRTMPSPKKSKKVSEKSKPVKKSAARAKTASTKKSVKKKRRVDVKALPGAKAARLPGTTEPQLATLAKEAPPGDAWLQEIKFDGYRMICRIDGGQAKFISRNDQDWTDKFGHLAGIAAKLPVRQALLDGEVVAHEETGLSSFQALQNAQSEGRARDLIYYVFDLLYLDGYDLRQVSLEQRKEALQDLIPSTDSGQVRYVEHLTGSGPEFFEEAGRLGLEGIICKRRDRPYVAGRGYDWLKVKCVKREEFVIGGYTPPEGARAHFGALLLGYHDGEGNLRYAGRVGTGFTDQTLRTLHEKLSKLEQPKSPFVNLSGNTGQARGVHWVKPRLVGQIEFTNWTRDAMLRHPSFQGLREDKQAREIVRDQAISEVSSSNGSITSTTDLSMPSSKRTAAKTRRSSTKASKTVNRGAQKTVSEPQKLKDEIAGVRLTSPDKVLYEDQGITKFDLAAYYVEIADWILPHLVDRPLSLVRCPDGRHKECFFQKHPGMGVPKSLRRIPIKEKTKTADYLIVDDISGLVSLVQIGVLELHLWGAKSDDIERPDRLIFDLDPDPSVGWQDVIEGALRVRELLENVGLRSFVKTTGGKGLHVVVPVTRRQVWDEAKAFCRAVTEAVVRQWPDEYTSTMSKAQRKGKTFIDYFRNDRGATAIAAYSTRSRPGAPVSVPLDWDELSPKLKSDYFNIKNLSRRVANLKHDPWRDLGKTKQSITAAMQKKLGV